MEVKEQIFAEERKRMTVEHLKKNQRVTVNELSELFKVSEATIRTDFREMEKDGLIKRTHGGAMLSGNSAYEKEPIQKVVEHIDEKNVIASKAVQIIDDGDTILLDTGSTTAEIAKLLGNKKRLKVVTNDIDIIKILDDFENCSIIMIGGTIRRRYNCTVGLLGDDILSRITVDKVFVAVNGISVEKGLSTPDANQADMKRKMIAAGNEIFAVCDNSKLCHNAFISFAKIEDIDALITDDKVDEATVKQFQEVGIEVIGY